MNTIKKAIKNTIFASILGIFLISPANTILAINYDYNFPVNEKDLEDRLFNEINKSRVANGIPEVVRSSQADIVAKKWAKKMASQQILFHNQSLEKDLSSQNLKSMSWAENVGFGDFFVPDKKDYYYIIIKANNDAMMAEIPPNDGHRKNILNANYEYVGIGVIIDIFASNNAQVWLVEDFYGTKPVPQTNAVDAGNVDIVSEQLPPLISEFTVSESGKITPSPFKKVKLTFNVYSPNKIVQMSLSNDNKNWTPWLKYLKVYEWDILNSLYGGNAQEGSKVVYVQFKDSKAKIFNQKINSIVYNPTNKPILSIVKFNYDAVGDDNKNLNGEYVTIKNNLAGPIILSNWYLQNSNNETHYFKNLAINAGKTFTIYSGKGNNGADKYYMNRKKEFWNNKKDTLSIFDVNKKLIIKNSY